MPLMPIRIRRQDDLIGYTPVVNTAEVAREAQANLTTRPAYAQAPQQNPIQAAWSNVGDYVGGYVQPFRTAYSDVRSFRPPPRSAFSLRNAGDFLNAAGERVGGGLVRQLVRSAPIVTQPFTGAFGPLLRPRIQDAVNNFVTNNLEDDLSITRKNEAARAGSAFGQGVKVATDVAGIAAPALGAERYARGTQLVQRLAQGGRPARFASWAVPELAAEAASTAAAIQRNASSGMAPDPLRDVGTGVAFGLGASGTAGALGAVGRRVLSKATQQGAGTVAENIVRVASDDEFSHITTPDNLVRIIKDKEVKPRKPDAPGYEGQNAVYFQRGNTNPYGFPGQDNVQIIMKGNKLPDATVNGDELAVPRPVGAKPEDVLRVEVPNETLVPTLEKMGYKAVVNPNLAANAPNGSQVGVASDEFRAAVQPLQETAQNVPSQADPLVRIVPDSRPRIPRGKPAAGKIAQGPSMTPIPTGVDTTIPTSPSVVKRAALSVKGELDQYGSPGQRLSQGLSQARDMSEIGQAAFMRTIPTVTSLKKDEFAEFVDALDALSRGAQNVNVSDRVGRALDEWTAAIPQVRQLAEAAGLDVGNLGPYYFPRDYSDLLRKSDNVNKLAQELVRTGQAKDLGEAFKTIQFMKRRYDTAFGHFENARMFDLPGYDKSKNALVNYINGAYNRIGEARVFGPNGEAAQQLIGEAASQGYDGQRILDLYQIGSGVKQHNRPVAQSVSGGLRAFNRLRSLGLSAILNAGQSVNTATALGVGRTARAFSKMLSAEDRAFVQATGVTSEAVLAALREQTGMAGRITGKLTAPGFNTVERMNRSVAAIAGRDIGNDLAARAASGDLRAAQILRDEFGVAGDIGARLTPEQEIQAARRAVERTQFKVDPQDLPAWANTPEGKLVAQFRTFSYKQTKFIMDEVIKRAAQGNPMPLLRFLAVGAAVGFLTGQTRATLRGQPFTSVKGKQEGDDESTTAKFVEALNNVGAFGIGSSALFLAQNRDSYRLPEYVAGTIGGPTVGYAAKTLFNIASAAKGDATNLGRQGLQAVPVAGPWLSNRLLPFRQKGDKVKIAGGKEHGIERLPDGRFGANIDGRVRRFSKAEDARKAVDRDKFEKSGKKSMLIGDTYFYKSKSGGVRSQPRVLYEWERDSSRINLAMDRAYDKNDVENWLGLAEEKLGALERKKALYDPETEADELDKITLQQENLVQQINKYSRRGYTTRTGSGGKSGGRQRSGNGSSGNRVRIASGGRVSAGGGRSGGGGRVSFGDISINTGSGAKPVRIKDAPKPKSASKIAANTKVKVAPARKAQKVKIKRSKA